MATRGNIPQIWLRSLRPQQIMQVSKRRQAAFLVALRQRLRDSLSLGAISVARLAALMLGMWKLSDSVMLLQGFDAPGGWAQP